MRILWALLCALLIDVPAFAQHDVGRGGDPLMLVFAKARVDAAYMLDRIAMTGISMTVDHDARSWLLATDAVSGMARYAAMAKDVRASRHRWTAEDVFQDRCAVTNVPATAERPQVLATDIFLSLRNCRAGLLATTAGDAVAVRTLVHESTHHFDVTGSDADEDFASLVGNIVYNTWLADRIASTPHWQETAVVDAPEVRSGHTAVFTGDATDDAARDLFVIWGGCNLRTLSAPESCTRYLKTGGVLRLRRSQDGSAPTMDWQTMDEHAAPPGRMLHSAIFTAGADYQPIGDRMIIFGGCRGGAFGCSRSLAVTACASNDADCDDEQKNDIIYDPSQDTWDAAPSVGAPSPRVRHTAVWSGSEMIVWGGLEGLDNPLPDRVLGDGGALRFDTDHPDGIWRQIKSADAPAARSGHVAVWTGSQMIVWGGCLRPGFSHCMQFADDGGIYTPPHDGVEESWQSLPAASFLQGRVEHTAIWTGRYLMVWGGRGEAGVLANGGMLDMAATPPQWLPLSAQLPTDETGRTRHSAAWDSLRGRMIIWGGLTGTGGSPATTMAFDPTVTAMGRWTASTTSSAPVGRVGQVATWALDALLVWGGYGADGRFLQSGGLFNP